MRPKDGPRASGCVRESVRVGKGGGRCGPRLATASLLAFGAYTELGTNSGVKSSGDLCVANCPHGSRICSSLRQPRSSAA